METVRTASVRKRDESALTAFAGSTADVEMVVTNLRLGELLALSRCLWRRPLTM